MKKRLLLRFLTSILPFIIAAPFTCLAEDEFFETLPDGTRPPSVTGTSSGEDAFGGAARQSSGALSGRVVFTSGGHGWTWGETKWNTQRGIGHEMNEDYGNLDQMNFFVPYAFNAGATVVAFRPIGHQRNEVVLDNDSPGVKFSGKWFNSRSPVYFGKPGAVPYKFALLDKSESATATYTPKIPESGFYPVYTWARHGPDRTSQLYRIQHSGGQTLVRVPHHMVGSGWVYLGTYYFNAGADPKKGSVIVSNLQPSPGFGAVAVADAIRFGNGMGDIIPVPGAPISTYPREEEASRYWVLKSLGQGQTNVISVDSSNQQSSNVSAPIRMARAMNRDAEGNMFKRVYLSLHSNSGGGRGALGLWNDPKMYPGTKTPNQERYAQLISGEVMNALVPLTAPDVEVPWFKRNNLIYSHESYPFGEINNKVIEDKFDATILEVAFHDSREDSKLLRDPKVRNLVARNSCQAIVRYMNEFDGGPLQFLPEPPRDVRAFSSADGVQVAWHQPVDSASNSVDHYLVYRSANGYGFGNPIKVPSNQISVTLPASAQIKDEYFRVTAVNAGGESLPSMVVGCRRVEKKSAPRILFVNGFTEFDRFTNPRQSLLTTNYLPPSAEGKMDRVIPRLNNAFDYVVQHGKALAANGAGFDSCQREAVANGEARLGDYDIVIWAAGKQTTNLFSASEQQALASYVNHGGNLFLSGSFLSQALQPSASTDNNLSRQLHVSSPAPPDDLLHFLSFIPANFSAFRKNESSIFGDGSDESYFVNTASRLVPAGPGARASFLYADGSVAAGVEYDGSAGGGKVVCFGFPFECISSAKTRTRCMADILKFFGSPKRR